MDLRGRALKGFLEKTTVCPFHGGDRENCNRCPCLCKLVIEDLEEDETPFAGSFDLFIPGERQMTDEERKIYQYYYDFE